MKKILPFLLIVIGILAGAGSGLIFKPVPVEISEDTVNFDEEATNDAPDDKNMVASGDNADVFVRINNQFVIPIVDEIRVNALVVLSVSLKVGELDTEEIYSREPLLRDAFLQVLFDHAYMGGFDGVYTTSSKMDLLKEALLKSAKGISGDGVEQILITDIVRQDL